MTYSDPQVSRYIADHFVAYKADMSQRNAWPLFRTNHVIWTPSAGFADRNGSMHHVGVGYSPPPEFLTTLKIGRARCLIAWTRNAEAAHLLEEAASEDNAMTPEALFWLSTAYFFERRDSTRMYTVWEELVRRYPDSPWARHTYPKPE
ncbi:MAG TPA: hypothetical protein VF826_07245 [Chloroflexia bacterium]